MWLFYQALLSYLLLDYGGCEHYRHDHGIRLPNVGVYRGIQHDCNDDERYRPLQVDMFKRQNKSKNNGLQAMQIKSPKNIYRCRHREYQWLFYNLSPNTCKFKIVCDRFKGSDCDRDPNYILQLFSIDQWNPQSGVFHREKEEKENEKICREDEVHQRNVKINQALVVDMYLLLDALDLPQDAEFSCQVTYDCIGIKHLAPGQRNHTVSHSEVKATESTTNFQEIQQPITPSVATESTTNFRGTQQTTIPSTDIGHLDTPIFEPMDPILCDRIHVGDHHGYDLCIKVEYENGTKNDIILLNKINGEETVFEGILLKEKCPVSAFREDPLNLNNIEVFMHSSNSPKYVSFNVSLLERRKSTPILGSRFDSNGIEYKDGSQELAKEENMNLLNASQHKELPKEGFRMDIHVYYDQSFYQRFGQKSLTRIRHLLSIVKVIFSDPSLTTIVEPNVIKVSYYGERSWEASGTDLKSVSKIAHDAKTEANAYVFLCSQQDKGGIIGVAWLSSTCHKDKFRRSSIIEYVVNDVMTAKTIAHELAHNLGMFHDFESDGKERFSSNSILCTGIGGYMDYGPNFNRWSECSVEDFTEYYNSYPDWCLASLASDAEIVSTTIKTATTLTETPTAKVIKTTFSPTSTTASSSSNKELSGSIDVSSTYSSMPDSINSLKPFTTLPTLESSKTTETTKSSSIPTISDLTTVSSKIFRSDSTELEKTTTIPLATTKEYSTTEPSDFNDCPNQVLEDLSSLEEMKKYGWVFDVTNNNDEGYRNKCGKYQTWYGYSYGKEVGSIHVALFGSGNATLNYGNCYRTGQVNVLLNGKEISQATANVPEKTVSFSYTNRNILTLKEINTAIIKVNSINFSCRKTKNQMEIGSTTKNEMFKSNIDEKLENLSSAEVMRSNGWRINASYSMDSKYRARCGGKTWYGYNYGMLVGSAEVTFQGSGTAKLSYGNCYPQGQVIVYLNGVEISRAATSSMKEVTFHYEKDDTLVIQELNIGIIKLNSLELNPLKHKNEAKSPTELYFHPVASKEFKTNLQNDTSDDGHEYFFQYSNNIGNFSSPSAMRQNGWIINLTKENDPKYAGSCGTKTWFGYEYGWPIGSIMTTFPHDGKAILNFGNCYFLGYVTVELNGKEISRAGPNDKSREVEFEFLKGDEITIKEVNVGIIKLNSLKLKESAS